MNDTELLSEIVKDAGETIPARKKEIYGLPQAVYLIIILLSVLLLAACAINAAAISRLQIRAEELEAQAAQAQSALAEAQAQLEQARIEVSAAAPQSAAAAPVDYDTILRAVAHRGLSKEAPENTLPAFRLAAERGFRYVETDIQFTADGVPVCLHDEDIDRTSDGSGMIDSLTLEQVRQYDFGSWKSEDYAGTRIPTFEEFLYLCRNLGLHPYIEMKAETVSNGARVRQLVQIVEACGMKGKVTWISFSHYLLTVIRDCDPEARLGYLVEYVDENAVAMANILRNGQNEVFLDTAEYTDEGCQICMDNHMPLEFWVVDKTDKILNLNPYITGVTSNQQIAGKIRYEAVAGRK